MTSVADDVRTDKSIPTFVILIAVGCIAGAHHGHPFYKTMKEQTVLFSEAEEDPPI